MALAFAGSANNAEPSGAASGDLLVAFIVGWRDASVTPTSAPSFTTGWTSIATSVSGGSINNVGMRAMYIIRGASAPSFATSGGDFGDYPLQYVVHRYTGHDSGTPIDGSGTDSDAVSGSALTLTPSVTVPSGGAAAVCASSYQGVGVFGTPSGFTAAGSISSGGGATEGEAFYRTNAGGTQTPSLSNGATTDRGASIIVAIRAASSGVSLAASDSAAGTDSAAAALRMAVADSDSGAGADSAALRAAIPLAASDAATGTDSAHLTADGLAASDTAAGTDSAALQATNAAATTDTATGTDSAALALAHPLAASDTGAGTDASNLTVGAIGTNHQVVVASNSLGAGSEASGGFHLVGANGLASRISGLTVLNQAYGSITTQQLINLWPGTILPLESATKQNWILVWESHNQIENEWMGWGDYGGVGPVAPSVAIANEIARLEAFAATVHSEGWKIAVVTVMPVAEYPLDDHYATFCADISSSTAFDGLFEIRGALPDFEPPGPPNPRYADLVHFTDQGYDESTEAIAGFFSGLLAGQIPLNAGDTAAGTDSAAAALRMAVADTDTAAGADTAGLSHRLALSVADTATGTDSAALRATNAAAASDSGAGVDTSSLFHALALADADSGTSTDSSALGTLHPLAASDSATGADSSNLTPGGYSATDTATGSDATAAALRMAANASDAATGTDAAALAAAHPLAASDSALGTDSSALGIGGYLASDTATGTDAAALAIRHSLAASDAAAGTDSSDLSLPSGYYASDSATGTDSAALVMVSGLGSGDVATGSDTCAASVLFALSATDTAVSTDSATFSAAALLQMQSATRTPPRRFRITSHTRS